MLFRSQTRRRAGFFLFGFDVRCAGPHAERRADGDRLYALIAKGPYWCEMLQTRKPEVVRVGDGDGVVAAS